MADQRDPQARCIELVAVLDVELGWQLSPSAQQEYGAALARYLSATASDAQARALALRYHQDHALVQALLERGHERHDTAWTAWMGQVIRIIRHAGLGWSDDPIVDLDDLAQVARMALAQSLPSFRYTSRLSTWAHQVIVRSVQRYLRDRQAQKRAGRPLSLEQAPAEELPSSTTEPLGSVAEARVLAEHIDALLSAQPDQRLAMIFRLWAQHDMPAEEIGRRIHLSPSQVRVLLKRIREMLQRDATISSWRNDPADDPAEYSKPKDV